MILRPPIAIINVFHEKDGEIDMSDINGYQIILDKMMRLLYAIRELCDCADNTFALKVKPTRTPNDLSILEISR